MAPGRAKPSRPNPQRQAQASRPRGVEKRPQRPPRRSARLANAREAKTTDGEPRRLLPSPPTSNTLNKETKTQQPPTSSPRPEAARASQPPQESDVSQRLERKRKRSQEDYDLRSQTGHKPTGKRARTSPPACPSGNEVAASGLNRDEDDRVRQWIETATRSEPSSDNDPNMSRPLNKKRSSSSMSYSQGVKEGLNPPQYTPEYEILLQDAGIHMNEESEVTISDPGQELDEVLLNSFFPPPSNSLFTGQTFLLTLDEARNENEPRVQRDILPLLVPCASLLYLQDRIAQCQNLAAKVQGEWTKVTPLAGPLPIPDYAVGLKPSAFTLGEISQLQIYTTPNKPTLFRDGLYFPFFVCEIKCGEKGLSIAERQSMHAASVAANAIVELFRDRAVSRVGELHRRPLVYSISHDHTNVRIHRHYACIEGDGNTLRRRLVRSFDLRDRNGKEKWTTYHIVRKIYDHFAPIHLKRIRSAIAQLPVDSSFGLSSASLGSNPGVDTETESDSQEMAEGAPSSKGTERPKKPRLRPTAMLQQENDYLKKDREYLKEQLAQERQQASSNASISESKLQQENEYLKERLTAVITQLQTSGTKSGNDSEVVTMLRQQNAEMKEQMDRQRQDHKHEMDELKDLLKQSLSAQPKQRGRK